MIAIGQLIGEINGMNPGLCLEERDIGFQQDGHINDTGQNGLLHLGNPEPVLEPDLVLGYPKLFQRQSHGLAHRRIHSELDMNLTASQVLDRPDTFLVKFVTHHDPGVFVQAADTRQGRDHNDIGASQDGIVEISCS